MTKDKYEMQSVDLGLSNPGFDSSEVKQTVSSTSVNGVKVAASPQKTLDDDVEGGNGHDRQQWSNQTEFLLSCIAMSVGLGNVWRFPFTAYENGGGAFLIPYLIVLFIVGKPLYYMEMSLGQFSSKGSVKIWEVVPALKGIGYGQLLSTTCVMTYYCSLMGLTIFYFAASFQSQLPWTKCMPEWDNCFDSVQDIAIPTPNASVAEKYITENSSVTAVVPVNMSGLRSSSELYFQKYVLNEADDGIDNGIGLPEWRLLLCLLLAWIFIFLIIVRGVQSSGKAAYFMAIFPYIVLFTLLIRGVTLPGSVEGILFFIRPQWGELLNPKVN
ncbi:hypothetical protein J437_LFUL012480 [Ladona fulva]|uniref:Transporter n=1 Tax=Ladona fulva TaxID=123851 RepID=A0A8K0P6P8_LADFU|nr:hypothetical protein J437_LFUL012480 [Ladona fulva]